MGDQWRARAREALVAAWQNRWHESWQRAAEAADLEVCQIATSDGGEGRRILAVGSPSSDALREFVQTSDVPDRRGWKWCELPDGERIECTTPAAEQLREAVAELDHVGDFEVRGAREKRQLVADVLDISETTVYRRMDEAGWSTADLEEEWREQHRVVHNVDFSEFEHQDILLSDKAHLLRRPEPFEGEPREQAIREHLEERAAIMEYSGELDRADAETLAWHHLRASLFMQAKATHDKTDHPDHLLELYNRLSSDNFGFCDLEYLPTYQDFVDGLWFVLEEFYQTGVDTERHDAPIGNWERDELQWRDLHDEEVESWGTSYGVRDQFKERRSAFHDAIDHIPDVPTKIVQRVTYTPLDGPPDGPGHEILAVEGRVQEFAPHYNEPGPTRFELVGFSDPA